MRLKLPTALTDSLDCCGIPSNKRSGRSIALERHTGRKVMRTRRAAAVAAMTPALACMAGGPTSSASAQLPGSGYTFDRFWNCGQVRAFQNCFFPGVLGFDPSQNHTWGWGSADFDGAGSPLVTIVAQNTNTGSFFGATAERLARACYLSSCNDQDGDFMLIRVGHGRDGDTLRTIFGHGKA